MANELAVAYISLVASSKDLGKQVTGDLGKAGDEGGKKAGGRFVSSIGGVLKKSALGVGAAVGGMLTTAIFKGWNRMTDIENAEAKLSGLGHSAKDVTGIMDDALKSVKGTAFGLDEAATIAASATAAGIKPGKDLQRTLGLVADAATIGGTSLSDMGAIFNKVAASNKIQGDTIDQLNEKGIPIVQLLGKTMGKTSADVTALASKGKIDFATFQKAMEGGLAGAALKSGETTQGAFKNMNAALGRFGVALLQGVFPAAKTVFGGITGFLDNMTAKVGPVVEKVTKRLTDISGTLLGVGKNLQAKLFPILQNARADLLLLLHGDTEEGEGGWAVSLHDNIVKAWNKSQPYLQNFRADILLLLHGDTEDGEGGWAVALHNSIASAWDKSKHILQNWRADALLLIHGDTEDGEGGWAVALHDQIVNSFEKSKVAVAGFQAYLSQHLADAPAGVTLSWPVIFQNAMGGIASTVSGGLRKAQGAFQAASPKIRATLADTFSLPPGTAESWGSLLDAGWGKLADALGRLGKDVWGGIKTFLDAARPGFEKLWDAIKPLVSDLGPAVKTFLPLLNPFTLLFKTLRPLLPDIAQTLGEIASSIGGFLASAIKSAKPLLEAIISAFSRLMPFVQKLVASLLPPLADLFNRLAPMLDAIFKALSPVVDMIAQGLIKAVELLQPIVERVFGVFADVIKDAIKAISGIVDFITGVFTGDWSKAWDGVKKIFSGFWDGIKAIGGLLLDWFLALPKLIVSLVGQGAVALGKLGVDLMTWIWNGIKNLASSVWSWFGSLAKTVIDWVGKGAANLVSLGKNVLTWIWNGIKNVATSVWTWFASLPGTVVSKVGSGTAKLLQLGKDLLTWIWNGIKSVASDVWDWFTGVAGNIGSKIGGAIQSFLGIGRKIISYIGSGIRNGAEALWDWVTSLPGWILGAILGVWNKIVGLGRKIVEGIVNGLSNLGSAVKAAIKDQLNLVSTDQIVQGWMGGARASGGPLDPGWTVVGEQGPELLYTSPAGGMVYSNPASRRMLANAKPASPSSSSADIGAQIERALAGWTVVADPTGVSRMVRRDNESQGNRIMAVR